MEFMKSELQFFVYLLIQILKNRYKILDKKLSLFCFQIFDYFLIN